MQRFPSAIGGASPPTKRNGKGRKDKEKEEILTGEETKVNFNETVAFAISASNDSRRRRSSPDERDVECLWF